MLYKSNEEAICPEIIKDSYFRNNFFRFHDLREL
jgi:hypothetical protein